MRVASRFGQLTSLEAHILDASGAPVAGAHFAASSLGFKFETTSDGNGHVRLETRIIFQTVPVRVLAHSAGRAWHGQLWVAPGREVELGDVYLLPYGTVAGRVVDEAGESIANAEVLVAAPVLASETLDKRRRPHRRGLFVFSNRNGEFRFPCVSTGPMSLCAGREGYGWTSSENITVGAGMDVTDVVVELGPAPASTQQWLEGVIVDKHGAIVPRATLVFEHETSFPRQGSVEGRFKCAWQFVPASIWAFGEDGTESRRVILSSPDEEIRLELNQEPMRISVLVRDDAGRLVVDGSVESYRLPRWDPNSSAHHPRLGRSSLEGTAADPPEIVVPNGRFFLQVSAEGFRPLVTAALEPMQVRGTLELQLERPAAFDGAVSVDGEPVAGATVSLISCDEQGMPLGSRWFQQLNDKLGEVSATTRVDGSYRLVSYAPVADSSWPGVSWVLLRAQADDQYVERGPFSITEGPFRNDLSLAASGVIDGRLVVPLGRDPAGWKIVASRGLDDDRRLRVDSDGRFQFADLAPGLWALHVNERDDYLYPIHSSYGLPSRNGPAALRERYAREGGARALEVDVRAGHTSAVELRFDAPGIARIHGHVRFDGAPAELVRIKAATRGPGRGASTYTDAQGSFELWIESDDEAQLSYHQQCEGYRRMGSQPVEINSGTGTFERDIPSATLIVEGAAQGERFAHKGVGPENAGDGTALNVDADVSSLRLHVAAGRGLLTCYRAGEAFALELDLEAGEERTLHMDELSLVDD